jgi:hypothetical protein
MKHIRITALLHLRVPVAVGVLILAASTPGHAQVEDPYPDDVPRSFRVTPFRVTPSRSMPYRGPVASAPAPAPAASPAAAPVSAARARSSAAAAAGDALRTLGARVGRTSDPTALRTALEAYYAYRDAHPEQVRKPYLYFVDFGLGNASPRGWVFDMDAHRVVEGPFMVAHGRGSGPRNGVPKKFSNRPGSYASSLGLYLAQETYTFSGTANGRRYTSVGLRMRGESGSFNGAARARGIVAHGAPYVSARESGRSEGCPAMEPARARRLLPLIADGGVVFIYSPNDSRWLRRDPWVNAAS